MAGSSQAKEPAPLVVGATVSLEGQFKDISLQMQQAMRLWEKQVNQGGGLLGRPVRLLLYDDKSDPGLIPGLYAKLLDQDKVDLLAAPYGSALTLAATEISEPQGYVMLATASGEEIWQRGFRYIFGIYTLADRYFIGVMDLLARRGFGSVAVVHAQDSFSRSAARGCREWAERLGLRVTLEVALERDGRNLPAILEKARQVNADCLVLCSYPPDAYRAIASLRQAGYRPPVLAMAVAPALPDFAEKAGDFAEGVMGPSQWEPDERIPYSGTRRFIKAFQEQFGHIPSYHAASAYAGLVLLQSAVEECKCLDQDRIREYLLALDSLTLLGRFKVDLQGRQVGHSPFTVQWQQGRKEIIYPPKLRTAQPQMPTPSVPER